MIEIRRYEPQQDEEKLLQMLREEGDAWVCYWGGDVHARYLAALKKSISYVAVRDGDVIGFSRALDDCGFYIYVCDLLVKKEERGKGLGLQLMQCLCVDYPGQTVYVMSDVDGYYQKLGLHQEGSVFVVKPPV